MPDHLRTLPVTSQDFQQLVGEQRLYVVLDACTSPVILAKVRELGPSRAPCLYLGGVAPQILEVAPYLARVDGELLQWLIDAVWSMPWGIFLVAKLELEAVRKQLRKFLRVKSPDGELMYFRYYDPRVLPVFLESCIESELASFFAGISAFGCATVAKPGAGLLFQRS
jgi:hypothetical protein